MCVACYYVYMSKHTDTKFGQLPPICGADLERWRVEHNLTKAAAAELFGLQPARWDALTKDANLGHAIADFTIAMLLHLYRTYPNTVPTKNIVNVGEFFDSLGLQRTVNKDRAWFAWLIGRAPAAAHQILLHNGTPGRPLIRWIEAVQRMKLPADKTMRLMEQVADHIRQRQQLKRSNSRKPQRGVKRAKYEKED